MTEVYGLNEGQSASEPVSSQAESVTRSEPASERIFKQSEVNDIIKREKYGAVEDYKRTVAKNPEYSRQTNSEDTSLPRANQNQVNQNFSHEDAIRKIAAEEASRMHHSMVEETERNMQSRQAERIVHEFFGKVVAGKDKYADFDHVIGDVEFASFPNTVGLLHGYVDNVPDVLYDLAKDPIKMANLEALYRTSPKGAIKAIQSLSHSIKQNESGSKMRSPNEPLDQLRPSNTGTDTGKLEVRDFRKKYRV